MVAGIHPETFANLRLRPLSGFTASVVTELLRFEHL